MRAIAIVCITLFLTGCASAVYDSLDRRGVSSTDILQQRLVEFRSDAIAGEKSLNNAVAALDAIEGLDREPLALQLNRTRAAGNDAALASQQFRLSSDSLEAAASRYFDDQHSELSALKSDDQSLQAKKSKLDASEKAFRSLSQTIDATKLRLSPALSLYDAEVTALRRKPTDGAFAASRASKRDAAKSASKEVADSLKRVLSEAAAFKAHLSN